MSEELKSPHASHGRALPRRMQVLIIIIAAVVIAFAIALYASGRYFLSGKSEPAAAQQKDAPGTFRPTKEQWDGLKTVVVQSQNFRTEQITDGNIAVNDDTTTPVFSPYSGKVTRVIAKLGDRVAQGAPLMAVEASEVVQAQNDLVAAIGTLNTARSQLTLAQNNEKRQHELYLAKSGALKDWLQSQAELSSAQNTLRSGETALAAVRNRLRILGKSESEVSALESAPSAQQMNPEAIVRAPIAGIVVQRQVGVGQNISSAAGGAANPVYSIGNPSTVWLIANVRETDAPSVRIGQPVKVRVLAYPDRVFKAHITWIAPAMDPATRRLPVRAEVDNRDGALKPMMYASFSIMTGEDVTAPAVPQSALIYEGDQARVWVARDDGTVVSRSVRTGRISNGIVEISSGVSAGEKVISGGTLFIDRATQVQD